MSKSSPFPKSPILLDQGQRLWLVSGYFSLQAEASSPEEALEMVRNFSVKWMANGYSVQELNPNTLVPSPNAETKDYDASGHPRPSPSLDEAEAEACARGWDCLV